MNGPLHGVRIVDLSTIVMGPWASQMLSDMGAEIIKVETPSGDGTRQMGPARNPGMAALFLVTNRNKRSLVLDLQQQAGRDALLRVVDGADVLLHNFRPKVAAKLGLEYEKFRERNPRLVYCAAFGFASAGPLTDKPAYDDVIQSASGLARLVGTISDQPRYVPSFVADKTSAYAVASAITAALFGRSQTGRGQAVEVPMFETMADFLLVEHLYGATFEPPIAPMGFARILNKDRRPFKTLDGYVTVIPYTDRNWHDFFSVMGREDLASDPVFATTASRVANPERVYGIVAELVANRRTDDLLRDLEQAQIPAMPVQSIEDLLDDEQLAASGFWQNLDHPTEGRLRLTKPPIRFSEAAPAVRRAPPLLGEHSREILIEAGHTEAEVDQLLASGATLQARDDTPSGA